MQPGGSSHFTSEQSVMLLPGVTACAQFFVPSLFEQPGSVAESAQLKRVSSGFLHFSRNACTKPGSLRQSSKHLLLIFSHALLKASFSHCFWVSLTAFKRRTLRRQRSNVAGLAYSGPASFVLLSKGIVRINRTVPNKTVKVYPPLLPHGVSI